MARQTLTLRKASYRDALIEEMSGKGLAAHVCKTTPCDRMLLCGTNNLKQTKAFQI